MGALEHRKNQFVADRIQAEKSKAEEDRRYLQTLQRIEGRKGSHNTLTTNTKNAMELTHAAMENTLAATNAASTKVLEDATAEAEKAVAGVKGDFDTKHEALKTEHDTLADEVKTNKTETDDKLEEAKLDAKDQTTEAKLTLEKQLETQGNRINEQLGKHDTNHKITEQYILYHDHQTKKKQEQQQAHMKEEYGN